MLRSAKFAIDNDNIFSLEHLPSIDGLLTNGLTLFVDKDFPKYHDMTLIQYTIAKRKPAMLKFMLHKVKELKVNYQDILCPKTSNTKGNLLKLAIEFGSEGFYDTVDNTCLETILSELNIKDNKDNKDDKDDKDSKNDKDSKDSKDSKDGKDGKDDKDKIIPIENTVDNKKVLEKSLASALVQAIRCKNNDAIKILMKYNVNFFYYYKSNENNDVKNTENTVLSVSEFDLFEMPIMVLLKMHDDKDQLQTIFTGILKEKSDEIIDKFNSMTVDNKPVTYFLDQYKLDEVKEFLNEHKENKNKSIKPFIDDEEEEKEEEEGKKTKKIGKKKKEGEEEKLKVEEIQTNSVKCSYPDCDNKLCSYCATCHRMFCVDHINDHEENNNNNNE